MRDAVPRTPWAERTLEPTAVSAHIRRTRAKLEIQDLAARYGWQREVDRALARLDGPSLK